MAELTWDGKYDEAGRRVGSPRISLPFQTVETINESAQQRQQSLDFFAGERSAEWRNRLIWGDKKYVLPALVDEFAGLVDLIYIDPPFATGQDFSLPVRVGNEDFVKEPSMIEVKAYRDTWGAGLDSYLAWFQGMADSFRQLLRDSGSLYVHLDPGVVHYVKVILDDVFGLENFRNEIIWRRTGAHGPRRSFGPIHDTILFYTKSSDYLFNVLMRPYMRGHVERRYTQDESGKFKFTSGGNVLTGAGTTQGESGQPWRGFDPSAKKRHWAVPGFLTDQMPPEFKSLSVLEKLEALYQKGLIDIIPGAAWPTPVRYLNEDDSGQPLQDIWAYQPYTEGTVFGTQEGIDQDVAWLGPTDPERVDYPTQKPDALLERIIKASSEPNDLVLDCVCGSGTTAVVAEKLGRRWIAADLGRFAIHTTRKRLLSTPDVTPFVVQNLGKYERQLWQEAEFGKSASARTASYRSFILDLYHASPISGYSWLHGLKQGRMVHVGTVDAPVTVGDVKQIVSEFRKAVGTGKNAPKEQSVDILGWDFAFELNEIARQEAEKAGMNLRLVRIPREVLDKRAVEQGDVRFFELASLSVVLKNSRRRVTLSINDFVIPLDDVPAEVQKAVTHWSQWIDYWAVDWDNKDDTFHNEWQTYRTRNSQDISLATEHEYPGPGEYTVVVKVIDILGNDTTKSLSVKVAGRAT